jgi:hypothetical protein
MDQVQTRSNSFENRVQLQQDAFHLDVVLMEIGEFGRYQILLFGLVMIIAAYGYSLALAFSFVGFNQHARSEKIRFHFSLTERVERQW